MINKTNKYNGFTIKLVKDMHDIDKATVDIINAYEDAFNDFNRNNSEYMPLDINGATGLFHYQQVCDMLVSAKQLHMYFSCNFGKMTSFKNDKMLIDLLDIIKDKTTNDRFGDIFDIKEFYDLNISQSIIDYDGYGQLIYKENIYPIDVICDYSECNKMYFIYNNKGFYINVDKISTDFKILWFNK